MKLYLEKYLKYKKKYLELKNQIGGIFDCKDENLFGNKHGTCWNTGIQTMLLCSHITKTKIDESFELFKKKGLDGLLNNAKGLLKYLPDDMLEEKKDKLTDNIYELLNKFITDSYERINSRYEELKNESSAKVMSEDTVRVISVDNELEDEKPKLVRRDTSTNELCSINSFFKLLPFEELQNLGGDDMIIFYMCLILGIFLLNKIISYNVISLEDEKIGKIEIGDLDKYIGIGLCTDDHYMVIYKCEDNYVLYDDHNKKTINLGGTEATLKTLNTIITHKSYEIPRTFKSYKFITIIFFKESTSDEEFNKYNLYYFYYYLRQDNISKSMEFINSDNINNNIYRGLTPLHIAANYNKLDIVKQLIIAKADLSIPIFSNRSSVLHSASGNGYIDIVKTLIEAKANVHALSHYGTTALYDAVEGKHIKVVETLINAKANVNASEKNKNAIPLFQAVSNNNLEIVKVLISAKADVHAGKGGGLQTPIFVANDQKYTLIEEELLKAIREDKLSKSKE